jgi:DNA-binding protein Fis
MKSEIVFKETAGDKALSLEELVRQRTDFYDLANRYHLYDYVLSAVEKPLIEMILKQTGGNQLKAAKILGINRNTLHAKIKKLGIKISQWKKK